MAERKTYSFKSSGETLESRSARQSSKKNEIPIGIKTPMELGSGADGVFKMNTNLMKQVEDNFRNMIQTNHGERLGLYDFGANLHELAFELGSNENFDEEAIQRISATTKKYMPFIDLLEFEPIVERAENQHTARVGVRISYSIPKLNVEDRRIDVIIYAAG